MADYPGASRPYPPLVGIQNEFRDQADSRRFRNATVSFCQKSHIAISNLVNVSIGYLNGRTPRGVEDLAVFMRFLIATYHLKHAANSRALYQAVKGIPFHAHGRIGYTFRRRRPGRERGVFLFLQ